jgi:hypothetical protein
MANEAVVNPEYQDIIKKIEERLLSSSRLQIESTDPQQKRPLRRALRHAAGLKLMRSKFDSGSTLYLSAIFNAGVNAYCVYFNDKPIVFGEDNLIIWKASQSILNRMEIANSVVLTLSVMLTVLGYEVFINSQSEPFEPLIQGRDDSKSE